MRLFVVTNLQFMAQGIYNYKGINQSLPAIRKQIIDSVDYCYTYFRPYQNPEQLFKALKKKTHFINDPKGRELLQTAQTLFEDNRHNEPGAGDCDCFTILTIACFIANSFCTKNGNAQIILAGRTKAAPVHIYSAINWKGQRQIFDLTEPKYNQERFYPLIQVIPVKFY